MSNNSKEITTQILEDAENYDTTNSYFFKTTFERYITQMKILDKLKKAIEKDGSIVTKEYVKGRQNIYINPALKAYWKTSDSTTKTVSTLMRIIEIAQKNSKAETSTSPLMDILNGRR